MRVVIAGDYPADPAYIRGGVEAVLYHTVQALRHYRDLDVHVLTIESDLPCDQTVNEDGITVHRLMAPWPRGNREVLFSPDHYRLGRLLRALKPDVVHAHGLDRAYPLVGFSSGAPTLISIHGVAFLERRLEPHRSLKSQLRDWVLTTMEVARLRRSQGVFVINPYIRDCYPTLANKKEIFVVENPVEASYFNVVSSEIPGRILFVGHIDPRKDILLLLKAMAIVCRQVPHAMLHVAGNVRSQEYQAQLYRYIEQDNLAGNVKFLGRVTNQELLDEYGACSVLALSSIEETAPVVIGQAMAAGKPVVSTAVGGIPHMIEEGVTGYLVPGREVETLAARLIQVLTDDDLRHAMGQAARQVADARFTPEAAAARTYAAYQQVAHAA